MKSAVQGGWTFNKGLMMHRINNTRPPTWDALRAAKAIIESVGGQVKFPYTMRVCWGDVFQSLHEVSKDPRCEVKFSTLQHRMTICDSIEEATKMPPTKRCVEVVCWGEVFRSIAALANDPRCQVGYVRLRKKLYRGVPADDAVRNQTVRRSVKTIDEVLAKARRLKKPKEL